MHGSTKLVRLGVVKFLNSKPLIEGLEGRPDVELHFAVPSALAGMLKAGQVDAALVPVIDWARAGGAWERVSDAGIASDGQTLTVRIYSRVPPESMTVLHVDGDSHTSVRLARLIWEHVYHRRLRQIPLSSASSIRDCESVLLIGDKVVTTAMVDFEYNIDLGEAWKRWTGLPFVFAVWVAPAGLAMNQELGTMLNEARDRGVAKAGELAARHAPDCGWPVDLAVRYLTHYLTYRITPAARQGIERFVTLAMIEEEVAACSTPSALAAGKASPHAH
ncbi:MAG TPA: menaquinone biosynthesis protein [Phycisphaerae bacterium]|nr:menaquinone biosynthesis protein [Phycisphaerae bacterium]HRY68969.1 menaquinone biosynthesis protein [Phycisphaerae bacterium]HSA25796.1 menaquinone biosynthesis protein [Phycisphaerae bacterium]